MSTEYLVTWKRVGLKPKRKRYCSRCAAERFMVLLGPEPWIAFGRGPDEPYCCLHANPECDCDGRTNAEQSEVERLDMPPIEWIRLSRREVGEWEAA